MKNETMGKVRAGIDKMVKGVSPFLLKEGELADSQNMTPGFSWEQRKGQSTLTATAISGTPSFDSVFQYRKADQTEDMIVAHVRDGSTSDKIYYGSALPPNAITWTELFTMTQGCEATQFATVGNALLWANDEDFGIWRGASYVPSGVFYWDTSLSLAYNWWEETADSDLTTLFTIGADHVATDGFIVVAPMPIDTITVTIGTANTTTTTTMTVEDFNGDWGTVTATDGTNDGTNPLEKSGDITWTGSADVIPTHINGIFGFAYRVKYNTTALSAGTTISQIRVTSDPASVKDVPYGRYQYCTGCYYYTGDTDASYEDYMGYVNNDVTTVYADLSDYDQSDNAALYIGFPLQTNIVEFRIPPAMLNDEASTLTVYYWNEDASWDAVSNMTDGTAQSGDSLKQTGEIKWTAPTDEKARILEGETFEKFWYKLLWSADLSTTDVGIYSIRGVYAPDDPKVCRGVTSWKGRAWQIGEINNKNSVRYSAFKLPNVWNGSDSGWLQLGDRPLICGVGFYNEMVVFADTEMWMIQGNTPATFGKMRLSNKIGTVAPHSVVPIDIGVHAGGGDNLKITLAWFFYDGIYMFDGVKWFKVSAPDIDNFFDPDDDLYLNQAKNDTIYGCFDFETQCAMWAVCTGSNTTPDKVIAMHFPTMRYGIYDYETMMQSMCSVHNSTTGRYYTVAGGKVGKFYLLQSGTTDVDASNATTAVDAWITTRAIWTEDGDGIEIRDASFLVEAEDGGMMELDMYPDGSETPQRVTRQKLQNLGKKVKEVVYKPKTWGKQLGAQFRLRNRSKSTRFKPLYWVMNVDRGRSEE